MTSTTSPNIRVIQHVLDQRASSTPDHVLYVVPKSPRNLNDGFENITIARFANAVNRCVLWLRDNVKESGENHTLPFICSQDIRYTAFILAANKVGCKLLLLSPRNSDEAQRHLLGLSKSPVFLCGGGYEKTVRNIIEPAGLDVQALVIPELWEILDEKKVESLPFDATWEQLRHKPLVVMHTSGTSTGKPKPIIVNHGYYAMDQLLSRFPLVDGRPVQLPPYSEGLRVFQAMPFFHAGALFMVLFRPILQNGTVVFAPGDAQIDAGMVIEALHLCKCNRLGASPTTLQSILAREDGKEAIAKAGKVSFGSGPLAPDVAETLFKLAPESSNNYGSTEMNLLPAVAASDRSKYWSYFHFHPWSGVTMEPVGSDPNMCEAVIKRLESPAFDALQPVFENFPDIDEYRSKDIFVRHPTEKDMWKWHSRADDVISFQTGELLNPSDMEAIIKKHPKVAYAIVIGQGRTQPALLVEPADLNVDHKQFLEEIWPTVKEANNVAPRYGRIAKQYVVISTEPFKRTPKGTIQRTKTEELLLDEIDRVYEGSNESAYSDALDASSEQSVQQFVRGAASDILDLPEDSDEATNLFDHGLDSLRSAELVRALNSALQSHARDGKAPPRVDVSTVYNDPTIKSLSITLFNLANDKSQASSDEAWPESAKRLLARHTPVVATGAAILTGSTGSLGAHLLHQLIHDATYSHVYCLNRSETAEKAYLQTFPSDESLLHKVTFLRTTAIWSPFFGLAGGREIYCELLGRVRTVIHNAWPVNFLMVVEASNRSAYGSSFEPQFDGVANLMRFCAESAHKARLVYISSLSSVSAKAVEGIPEAIVTDSSAPGGGGGYGRSKWVTECIMDAVARENPGTVSQPIVIRPGQISGPLEESVEKGATGVGSIWNEREAIASLYISSAAVGALPDQIGMEEKLRWVPVDVVAKTTLEVIAHVDKVSPAGTFNKDGASAWNVTNIQAGDQHQEEVTWASMLPVVQARLEKKTGKHFPVVPMLDWIKRVESFGPGDGRQNPAFKLQDFFAGLAASSPEAGLGGKIDTQLTRAASRSLRELGGVRGEWVEYWMQGWDL